MVIVIVSDSAKDRRENLCNSFIPTLFHLWCSIELYLLNIVILDPVSLTLKHIAHLSAHFLFSVYVQRKIILGLITTSSSYHFGCIMVTLSAASVNSAVQVNGDVDRYRCYMELKCGRVHKSHTLSWLSCWNNYFPSCFKTLGFNHFLDKYINMRMEDDLQTYDGQPKWTRVHSKHPLSLFKGQSAGAHAHHIPFLS